MPHRSSKTKSPLMTPQITRHPIRRLRQKATVRQSRRSRQPEPLDQTAAEPAFKPEPLPPSSPLKPAPDPDLTIRGRYGPLPQRADDGREVWQVYARPFDRRADARVIALVITGEGLSERPTLSAIRICRVR